MKKILTILIVLVVFVAIALGGYFGYEAYSVSKAPDVPLAAEKIMNELLNTAPKYSAESEKAQQIKEALVENTSFQLMGSARDKRDAVQNVVISRLDTASLLKTLQQDAKIYLEEAVLNAKYSNEIYNEDLSYKAEVLEQAAAYAFEKAFANCAQTSEEIQLTLRYEDKQWILMNEEEVKAALWPSDIEPEAIVSQMLEQAVENPEYVRKTYTIEETAKKGPEPDRSKFGSTDDPAVVEALLDTPIAKQLIGDRKLAWNKDIELIPGTQIHYYLDETILSIVWQEEEALAVGTFAETIVADASQLRRKIAGDAYQNFAHTTASEFAKQTNAVLAVGGDLYHHTARNCGIVVYERELYRFEPNTCDTCYITADGDMLFSYRGQFKEQSEAEKFVEENDVLFSLCFGPALIDDGKDVTPYLYTWGEVLDTYARSALGMLGDKHYLTMNINCKLPNHYYLATLRQAADAMIAKGCIKAYALDGGQTATTVFNNQLINPVQFGWEREISDIVYFATAVPN